MCPYATILINDTKLGCIMYLAAGFILQRNFFSSLSTVLNTVLNTVQNTVKNTVLKTVLNNDTE